MSSFQGKVVSFCTSLPIEPSLGGLSGQADVSSQVAVTGAASGMGLAIARLLIDRGAILSLADKNEQGLRNAVESLYDTFSHDTSTNTAQTKHPHYMYTVVDVRQSSSVNAWIERTVQTFGRLDCAVNFAGVGSSCKVVDETDEGWELNMDVNARGVFFCTRAQLKYMKEGSSIVSEACVLIYGIMRLHANKICWSI